MSIKKQQKAMVEFCSTDQVAPFASSFASSNPVIVALAVVAAIGALSLSALRMKRSKKAGD